MGLFTIYPIIFTIWVSFTNYGEGHLVTEEQAINQILKMKYLPNTGMSYTWTAYKSPQGDYVLWLQDAAGNGYLAKPGEPLSQPKPGESGVGELDNKGIPITIEGYQRLNVLMAATDKNLTEILFGEAGKTIQVRSPSEAAELLPLYVYDPDKDVMINQETGIVYQNLRGSFYIARWHRAPTRLHRDDQVRPISGISLSVQPCEDPCWKSPPGTLALPSSACCLISPWGSPLPYCTVIGISHLRNSSAPS